MQPYFKRELLLGFSIIFGSVLILGALALLLSLNISSETGKAIQARMLLANRSAALGVLAELKRSASEVARYEEAMNKILVAKDQLIDFPHWLEGLARGRNLGFSFSFQGESPPSGNLPGHISFSVRVRGGLENIIGFVKEVEFESQGFLVLLDGFSLRRNGGEYDFSAGGRVFYKE